MSKEHDDETLKYAVKCGRLGAECLTSACELEAIAETLWACSHEDIRASLKIVSKRLRLKGGE